MKTSDTALDPTSDELEATLGAIATPAEIAMIKNYLALDIATAQSDAHAKASERTQRYKLRTALRREPSSQQILQACAYAVFTRANADALPLIEETLDLLVSAGFSRRRAGQSMKRFVADAAERKQNWVARTRVGLLKAIVTAITAKATSDIVTK